MSGLQEFLTPFSHLIFANRDKVIVLLAALLAWFTIQLLITRWRNERLERDLSAAKSGGSGGGGRRYAASPSADESHAEGGALPPVKGGRTYARNLGTALQKAGISGPQIYSPPTPAGWAPNANPAQAGGRDAQDLEGHGHRVGGELAAARARPGRGHVLDLGQLIVGDAA